MHFFRDFQTKIYYERGTIKKSKKPGKDNLFSFSGKEKGILIVVRRNSQYGDGEYFNVQHPRARVIYN